MTEQIKKWERSQSKKLLNTPIFSISEHQATLEDKSGTFYQLHAPDWINVIALTKEHHVILVEQYRHGTGTVALEIPGGAVDREDAGPFESAKRELLEETGYSAEQWIPLGRVAVNPSFMDNYCHLFYATGCEKIASQSLDEHEDIKVVTVPFERFVEMVLNETINHSLILSALAKLTILTQHGLMGEVD